MESRAAKLTRRAELVCFYHLDGHESHNYPFQRVVNAFIIEVDIAIATFAKQKVPMMTAALRNFINLVI